jgi:hypothetical protein
MIKWHNTHLFKRLWMLVVLPASVTCQIVAMADPLQSSASATMLKGSVGEKSAINPSLKVIPTDGSAGLSAQVHQFAAGMQYAPGRPAPIPRRVPIRAAAAAGAGAGPILVTVPPAPKPPPPPPKWNYTATPKNGIMSWQPGLGIHMVKPLAKPTVEREYKKTVTTQLQPWKVYAPATASAGRYAV